MTAIDLNADLGEGFPWDESVMDLVSSASISCGAHAGDDVTMARALLAAKRRGVAVGAHPGYPDREGFGRRERDMTLEDVAALVLGQVTHLKTIADNLRVRLRYIKPHGALYNQSQREPEMARGLAHAARLLGLALVGLPGSEVAKAAVGAGVAYLAEGFVDRGYRDDGSLIPRGQPGATLDDLRAIAGQVVRLVESGRIQTLCLHGDGPNVARVGAIVRETLRLHSVALQSFAS